MLYAKVDRVAGIIIGRQDMNDPLRSLDSPDVWLPYVDSGAPVYDSITNDLTRIENIPDLSNLLVDVPVDAVVDVVYTVVPLSQVEIDSREDIAALGQFDNQKLVKALGLWTAQQLAVPVAQAREEILTIYKGL